MSADKCDQTPSQMRSSASPKPGEVSPPHLLSVTAGMLCSGILHSWTRTVCASLSPVPFTWHKVLGARLGCRHGGSVAR